MNRFKVLTILSIFIMTASFPQQFTLAGAGAESALSMPGQNLVCQTSGKARICASVSNSFPAQYSNVTVYGSLTVNGVAQAGKAMVTAWHYKTTTSQCAGTTNSKGLASCTRSISRATKDYAVRVTITINGYSVATWFTPH